MPRRKLRLPWIAITLMAFTVIAVFYLHRSRSHCDRITFGRLGLFLDCGVTGLAAYTNDTRNRPPSEHWMHAPTWYWLWWSWGRTDNTAFSAMVSGWPFPLITGAAGLALTSRWWLRLRSNRCIKCGYDTNSLEPGDPCPECGLQNSPR